MQISVGKSKNATGAFRPVEVKTFEELAKIITSGFPYSLGTYKGEHRNKENFESASSIGLDFDGDYTLKEALNDFKDFKHIIATTRSHQKEKHGIVCDRFRVILFLTEEITDADVWYATWHSLAEVFPATDPQCKDPSRFWFSSPEVVSIQKEGDKITPSIPLPKEEKKPFDSSLLTPGMKGKLAKETLELLVFGKIQGGRNHATYKAAKDFQQNLYTIEEAENTILNSLNNSGTIARDFTEAEAKQTIKSAYNTEAKHDPRVKQKPLQLLQIGQFYESVLEDDINWLVEDLLQCSGVSLLAADPKTGKSAIARQLAANVIFGTDFLGRKVKKGTVHYYAIEEDKTVIKKSFKRLSIPNDAPLFVHAGDPLEDEGVFENFQELLIAEKPDFAIIDTCFDIIKVDSEKDYGPIKKAFRKVRKLARQTGTHIMLVHHAGKPQNGNFKSAMHGVLGSTGITAGVDDIIVIQLRGRTRLITSLGREVKPWNAVRLIWDDQTKTYTLSDDEDEDF